VRAAAAARLDHELKIMGSGVGAEAAAGWQLRQCADEQAEAPTGALFRLALQGIGGERAVTANA
jgi:hypothetical protein